MFLEVQSKCSHLPGDFTALNACVPAELGTRANATSNCFAECGITVLDWPAKSSDLNPIQKGTV